MHKSINLQHCDSMTLVSTENDKGQQPLNIELLYLCRMFSKTYGYALTAVTHIAVNGQDGRKIGLLELSQELDIPRHFLGKIMQDMVRHGIVDSTKGPSGGFYINEDTLNKTLLDILLITDGQMVLHQCALGIHRCNSERPCLLHNDFAACKAGLLKVMGERTIGSFRQVSSTDRE